jgi:hypothetical protein
MDSPNIMVRLPGWTFESALEDILEDCGIEVLHGYYEDNSCLA